MADMLSADLRFVTGPMAGRTVTLEPGAHPIGRDPGNRIQIRDSHLSRHHCTITVQDGRVVLRDADTVNGTFVAGAAVHTQELQDGDVIAFGDSEAVIALRPVVPGTDARGYTAAAATIDHEQEFADAATVRVRLEDARYGGSALPEPGAATASRTERDLQTLLAIGAALGGIRSAANVRRRVLQLLLDAIPATHGAVVLTNGSGDVVGPVVALRTGGGSDVTISQTMIRRAIHERAGLVCSIESGDPAFSDADSLVQSKARAVLCAPMLLGERVVGAFYLATVGPHRCFDGDDLELAVGVANVAALALENASVVEELESEADSLRAELNGSHTLVGRSAGMRAVYQRIARVAATDASVLIRGETGTGKEVVARAIHEGSPRRHGPFLAISCANLPELLLESELFGHEAGAFSGAVRAKKGKLEVANGGTVFLDEVAEMTPAVQAKLLRVIQERVFERLGGTVSIKVDVRIIAATHRDLEKQILDGSFREDLFYRLNVVSVSLPPLRERRSDIVLLARALLERHRKRVPTKVEDFSARTVSALESYHWPGNVRELENAILHGLIFGTARTMHPEDLPEVVIKAGSADAGRPAHYYAAVDEAKRDIIRSAIDQANGNLRQAARDLGLNAGYLHRLMGNLGLKKSTARG